MQHERKNAQVFCGSTQKTCTDHEKLKFAKFAKSKGSQLAWNLSGKLSPRNHLIKYPEILAYGKSRRSTWDHGSENLPQNGWEDLRPIFFRSRENNMGKHLSWQSVSVGFPLLPEFRAEKLLRECALRAAV